MFGNNKRKKTYLKDYTPPNFLIKEVFLHVDIEDNETTVTASHSIVKNPISEADNTLILSGVNLDLIYCKLNGNTLDAKRKKIQLKDEQLIIPKCPDNFTLEIQNKIKPKENFSCEGLYQSGDILCTQNEAEGFRKITYFLDRPDVMSVYTTNIIADKKTYPYLLANGDLTETKDLQNGRHQATWHDPHPKPCYLFALVAGDFDTKMGTYETKSGQKVSLEFYVDKGNGNKCDHALESLKKSMDWDEAVFGLEYDLKKYMIVAVDSFNMGAMENKGLNIFNSAYVLAKPETATDTDYMNIESVIAHEYFHNWTGNRVTCRDWFQLTLKEGLTVFRDQEFSADLHSRAVQRISDVKALRDRQFIEDNSPMAHPIQPKSFIDIDNFYTSTIYEKGAEVIRMIHTIIGKQAFRQGMDLYFERHDGQAVTTEDFVKAMEDASGVDLTQFRRWYDQAGTPRVKIEQEYDEATQKLSLTLSQSCPDTSDMKNKAPFEIPIGISMFTQSGTPIKVGYDGKHKQEEGQLRLRKAQESMVFENIPSKPVCSFLHDFSAPIYLESAQSDEDRLTIITHDPNLFNKYEAAQTLLNHHLLTLIRDHQQGKNLVLPEAINASFKAVLNLDDDPAFQALALTLPSQGSLLETLSSYDVDAVFTVRQFVLKELGLNFTEQSFSRYEKLQKRLAKSTNWQKDQATRAFKNTLLSYLCHANDEFHTLALDQFSTAVNMTDELAAFKCLVFTDSEHRQSSVDRFYNKWKRESLVMDKWLAIQAASPIENRLSKVKSLEKDPIFDPKNPNKIRSLYGAFTGNLTQFHSSTGEGYRFLGEKITEIDAFNPSIAARLAGAFKQYGKLSSQRKSELSKVLKTIVSTKKTSKNLFEVCDRILKG